MGCEFGDYSQSGNLGKVEGGGGVCMCSGGRRGRKVVLLWVYWLVSVVAVSWLHNAVVYQPFSLQS